MKNSLSSLRPPFLQSWRTVTRYVLRDTFDAAGISVGEPTRPWGIATLTANGTTSEPLLCPAEGFQLLTFAEIMSSYSDSLEPLFTAAGQADR
ncbi:hypothetical protein StoSoilB13_06730 [Arthrobacter sp. StoSoilB13]|nr:hypothetical protein StoSoilB13_06730 [Arthrobacter sp. StoSoilB13]